MTEKIYVKKGMSLYLLCLLLISLLLPIAILIPRANATHYPSYYPAYVTSSQFGATYAYSYWVNSSEYEAQSSVASYVEDCFTREGSHYIDFYRWGNESTNRASLTNYLGFCNDHAGYATNFWLGDYAGFYPFPQQFASGDGSTIKDGDILDLTTNDETTNSIHGFDFIWTCPNGAIIYNDTGGSTDDPGIGHPIDPASPMPTEPANNTNTKYYAPPDYGMAYAWTGRTDLYPDGFHNLNPYPSTTADRYCYIGFQCHSPWMLDPYTGYNGTHSASFFIEKFYDYATGKVTGQNERIWNCLQYAAMWTMNSDFDQSPFYKGWWWNDTNPEDEGSMAGWWFAKMNVFGNSGVTIPCILDPEIDIATIDDGTSWPVPTDVYVNGSYYDTITWDAITLHLDFGDTVTIAVDDPIPIPGYENMYWTFTSFDGGSGGNPTTLVAVDDGIITAHYANGYG